MLIHFSVWKEEEEHTDRQEEVDGGMLGGGRMGDQLLIRDKALGQHITPQLH